MDAEEFKRIRKELKYTQLAFAEKLGVDRRTIINYEKGNTIPSAIVNLVRFLERETDSQATKPKERITNKSGNKYIPLSSGSFDVEVEVIPFSAYASYLESLETGTVEEDFETTVFKVDQIGRGNYKAFIVRGDSMNGGRIDDTKDGSTVLGRELGRHHWKDGFRPTMYGWIILSKHNIFHKDITGFDPETGNITCHSRNPSPEFSDFQLNLNDVYQIFKVIKRIS